MAQKLKDLLQSLQRGDRLALAQAITLLESEKIEDQAIADEFMESLRTLPKRTSLRLGISGAPGSGKSSLIERIGLALIAQKHKVAVLAIDPSSDISKGSVLGDKTRMEELSRSDDAFIRPSPSRGVLGGLGTGTHDSILACEAAGYDIVIIETVGVGQSEAHVADLVDYFLFVALPGSGDELQGIKKGILEKVDAVLVNKADGENKLPAQIAQKQLKAALKILRQADIPTFLTSAVYGDGINEFTAFILEFWRRETTAIEEKRKRQEPQWILHYLEQFTRLEIQNRLQSSHAMAELEEKVAKGQLLPRRAARELLKKLKIF